MRAWSSSEIPPRDRRAIWVDEVCRKFAHLQCELPRDERFYAEISGGRLGDIAAVSLRTTAQRFARTSLDLVRDPVETFYICVQRSGRSHLSQDGREVELKPGDLVLADSVRPFGVSVDDHYSVSALHVPRRLLSRGIDAAEFFTAIRVDGTNGMGAILSPILRDLPLRLEAIPEAARLRVADNLLDLVAAALLSAVDGAPLSARLTLTRAKFWIEAHLADKLSAEAIARQCGLSVRHLNRLFEREGTSLMHHVWERRLARCHRDLADPALRHRSIGDIALAAGFNDLSHFSRAFRARFGLPARALREKENRAPRSRS